MDDLYEEPIKIEFAAKLARGHERFEKWRSKQKTRIRLLETLWSAAVKLAQEYGINRTARALRLDYGGLKKRTEASASATEPATLILMAIGGFLLRQKK